MATSFVINDIPAAMREIQRLTEKTDEEIVHGVAIDVCFDAVNYTKAADKGEIAKFRPVRSYKGVPMGHPSRLFFATTGDHRRKARKSGDTLTSRYLAEALWQARDKSRAYWKVHWLAAAKTLIEKSKRLGGRFLNKAVKTKFNRDLIDSANKNILIRFPSTRKIVIQIKSPAVDNANMEEARDKAFQKQVRTFLRNARAKYQENFDSVEDE